MAANNVNIDIPIDATIHFLKDYSLTIDIFKPPPCDLNMQEALKHTANSC